MWPSWTPEHVRIVRALHIHPKSLPGVANPCACNVLAWQIVASLRREKYYQKVQSKPVSSQRADPNHSSFDAERAVAYYIQQGNVDEAAWLIFLMTHFARPADTGWLRLQDVYGQLGQGRWDWSTVSANPAAFTTWLSENWTSVRGKYGSHRKYESLRPDSNRPVSETINSYVKLIGQYGHVSFYNKAVRAAGNDPHVIFDYLYRRLKIPTFGRLAKFDYLSLIGRYKIAPIFAGSAYLSGATGPAKGARLLFDGSRNGTSSNKQLQNYLDNLDKELEVGMAVLEDALCNWQKSPNVFVHFKG